MHCPKNEVKRISFSANLSRFLPCTNGFCVEDKFVLRRESFLGKTKVRKKHKWHQKNVGNFLLSLFLIQMTSPILLQ